MKTATLLLVGAAALAAFCGCIRITHSGYSDADLKAITNITQTTEIQAGINALEVDNAFGTVHVIGSDAATGNWSWHLTVRALDDASAQAGAAAASCRATTNGSRLALVVSLPDSDQTRRFHSDLEIRVPRKVSVRTENRFGMTSISDLAGHVEAKNRNGAINLRRVNGKVRAETSLAGLEITDTGPARLENQNGAIRVRSVHGRLEAQTRFGSLTARDIEGPAHLRDQNGSIEASAIRGSINAETSFGSLSVSGIRGPATLRNQNGKIEAEGVRGDAEASTDFGSLVLKDIRGDARLTNQNGPIRASDIAGSVEAETSFASMDIRAAGPSLVCQNQNGPMRIHASAALTNLEARTSFASLEVRLPSSMKPAIAARTSFGNVESDFPVLMKPAGEDPFTGIAPGTPRIRLDNQNGNIRVVRE